MHERSAQKAFDRAREKVRINRSVSAHTLRHLSATHLLESGIDLWCVEGLFGHKSARTTEIYTHVSETDLGSDPESAGRTSDQVEPWRGKTLACRRTGSHHFPERRQYLHQCRSLHRKGAHVWNGAQYYRHDREHLHNTSEGADTMS